MTTTESAPAGWRPGPSWAVVICVTAACARCGTTRAREDDEGTVHYDTMEEARAELLAAGWRSARLEDGEEELLCPGCAAADDCARLGHQPEEPSGPTLMPDGRTLPQVTYCDRCGALLEGNGEIIPAPDGYPAPARAYHTLAWDAAALPAGHGIARAAGRLLARLSDEATAARWDAWPGDQARRPAPAAAPDPAADHAAVRALTGAARDLVHAGGAAVASAPDAGLAVVLALTLERLITRVARDLDPDAGEGTLPGDPWWAGVITGLAACARECAQVLDSPQVTEGLLAACEALPAPGGLAGARP